MLDFIVYFKDITLMELILKVSAALEMKLDCSEPCHFDFLLCPTQNCPHHATVQVFSIIHCPFMSELFLCCGLDAHH